MFVKQTGADLATANLAFVPVCAPGIVAGNGSAYYQRNVDFTWSPGSRTVTLTADSTIPFKTHAEMHVTSGDNSYGSRVYWGEGSLFHGLQAKATYFHNEEWPTAWQQPTTRLPRTMAKMASGSAVKITVLGDSITAGYNATGFVNVNVSPYQKSWCGLVSEGIARAKGCAVTLTNKANAGEQTTSGFERLDELNGAEADLVMIAYGMNDSAANLASGLPAIIAGVQSRIANVEILLVTPMCGNPSVSWFPRSLFITQGNSILAMEAAGIGVADVGKQWRAIEDRKGFVSMSGNGVNHPNDYGHRLYAKVVLASLGINESGGL
jgi:hypothetical protein